MKRHRFGILFVLLVLLLSACGLGTETGFGERGGDPMQKQLQKRCAEIAAACQEIYQEAEKLETQDYHHTQVLSQKSVDEMEKALQNAGFDVMDTSKEYPAYLVTAEGFRAFWEKVQNGKAARQEIITIRESGVLGYRLFAWENGAGYIYTMNYPMEGGGEIDYEKQEILDWELTDRGNFYYRLHPAGDHHFADYSLIRLERPNPEYWDQKRQYLSAGGYIGTNLFLTDWTETDFGDLSFNDVWEYLYWDTKGEVFLSHGYPYIAEGYYYEIPAAEFEAVVLPYFRISLDAFREQAQYNQERDCYPWRELDGNEYVSLAYYTCEPEVTAYQLHADGTMTLTVEMLSTDLKTDCLFAHEVTVRPLENGKFQFVGNKVTYQTEYGLPFCKPRLSWGEVI